MRLAVLGASGRLGRRIVACAAEDDGIRLVAAVTRAGGAAVGVDAGLLAGVGAFGLTVGALGPGCFADADVVIDVSLPEGTRAALPHLGRAAFVVGVTGLDGSTAAQVDAEAADRAVLRAANFSAGVHVLAELVATAARALPDHDVEIVELHHRRKVDAPSGTATLLADAAAEARGGDAPVRHGREGRTGVRPVGEIGMHALRLGDVVGEHTVWLAGEGERLHLGHVATSRDAFAHGALRAARWLSCRPPGVYTMRDVLGLSR